MRSPSRVVKAVRIETSIKGGSFMNLKKTPIASAVALALMSAVYTVNAQQPVASSEEAQKSQAQEQTGDKAKDAKGTKQQATDAKTTPNSQLPVVVAQATTPPPSTTPPPVSIPGVTVLG